MTLPSNRANWPFAAKVAFRERVQICVEDGNVELDRAEEIADFQIRKDFSSVDFKASKGEYGNTKL